MRCILPHIYILRMLIALLRSVIVLNGQILMPTKRVSVAIVRVDLYRTSQSLYRCFPLLLEAVKIAGYRPGLWDVIGTLQGVVQEVA
jgi:hypothetical protein